MAPAPELELCDQETAELYALFVAAGLTAAEIGAYLKLTKGEAN
jgi:hypothetical protein